MNRNKKYSVINSLINRNLYNQWISKWTIDTGSRPSVVDSWYRFPTYNKLFKERFSITFKDLRCNSEMKCFSVVFTTKIIVYHPTDRQNLFRWVFMQIESEVICKYLLSCWRVDLSIFLSDFLSVGLWILSVHKLIHLLMKLRILFPPC